MSWYDLIFSASDAIQAEMFVFLILLVLQVALFALQQILSDPGGEDAKPPGLGDFNFATASESRSVPIVWGTRNITGPNVIWHGDLIIDEIEEDDVTLGFRFWVGMDLLLCYGPIDRVTRLETRDKEAFTGSKGPFNGSGSEVITVNKPGLYGGRGQGGGVQGDFRIFGGTSDQAKSSYLVENAAGGVPENLPNYVDIAHVVAEQVIVGESTTPGNYVFKVSRFPNNLGLAGDRHIVAGTIDNGDANIAEAIFEVLTSKVFGLGLDPDRIDAASFVSAGETLADEGIGVSQVVTRVQSAKDTLKPLLQAADALLFEDTNGKFILKLVRDDFGTISNLPLFDESNVEQVETFSRSSWAETANHINVKYSDRARNDKETGAMAQDLANFRTIGREVRNEISAPAIATREAGNLLAGRELVQRSFPFAKVTLIANRDAHDLRPGDVIRWSWSEFGVDQMLVRVMRVELGEMTNQQVRVIGAQDVFRTPAISELFAPPQATNFQPVSLTAVPFTDELVRAAPRILLNNRFATSGAFDPTLGERVWSVAKRPTGVTTSFEQWIDSGAGFEDGFGSSPVTPAGTLQSAYADSTPPVDATGFTLGAFEGALSITAASASKIEQGTNLALIAGATPDEDEIIGWEGFTDNGDGTVAFTGIHRGLLDTVPRNHSQGAAVFLFAGGQVISDVAFGDTASISVKHQAKTIGDELDIASATSLPITFSQRLKRPHAPVNFLVNGQRVAEAQTNMSSFDGVDLSFDWGHRTNDEKLFRDTDVASPNSQDAEVEYDLEFRDASTDTILRQETRVSPDPDWTSFLYTKDQIAADFESLDTDESLEVLLQARFTSGATNNPANLASLQQHAYTIAVRTRDRILQSIDLNGVDEWAATSRVNPRGFGDAYSLGVWLKRTADDGGNAANLFEVKPGNFNNSRILFSLPNNLQGDPFRIVLWNDSSTIYKDFTFGTAPAVGVWTFIAVTYDGSAAGDVLTVFQDGSDVTAGATKTVDNTGSQIDRASSFFLGVNEDSQDPFAGKFWATGVWNRVLGAAEITSLWNSGNGSAVKLNEDFGNYTGASELVHLWDWAVPLNAGADRGTTGDPKGNMLDQASNISAADFVSDVPT